MAKQVKPISITRRPEHFIPNVICPFCKQPTLGSIPVGFNEETGIADRFMLTCMFADCVLNFMTTVSWEFDSILQDLFKGTEYDKSETT
jgi:hypothetical protein